MPRRCNAGAGKVPLHAHDGVLGKLNRHRQYNNPISRDLMADPETRDIGRAIANCALTIKADVLIHEALPPDVNLKAARVCNTRLCPFCEWRRTRVWRARLTNGLNKLFEEKPKLRGVFLTLTVKNCLMDDLGDTINEMNRAWNRLQQRSFFPTDLWFRRTEVTVGYMPGTDVLVAHPHFHVLLLVKPSYFSHGYIKQTEWQKQWMDAARLDYAPVVDVRAAKANSGPGSSSLDAAKSSVVEAAKYAAKATNLMELGRDISQLHWQLRGKRLYALSKSLRRYVQDGDVSDTEMLDNCSKPLPNGTVAVEVTAQWFEDAQEYLITDAVA